MHRKAAPPHWKYICINLLWVGPASRCIFTVSVCLSICQYVRLSLCLSVSLYLCLSVCLYGHLFYGRPSVSTSLCPVVCFAAAIFIEGRGKLYIHKSRNFALRDHTTIILGTISVNYQPNISKTNQKSKFWIFRKKEYKLILVTMMRSIQLDFHTYV